MIISFAITVCNELDEIKKLVPFLLKNKRMEDEIVILFDEKNGDVDVLNFLLPFNKLPKVQTWRSIEWDNNFGDWKNKLNDYCVGDYIIQIDADEIISEYIVKNLYQILEMNPLVDLIFIPRVNTVKGIKQEDIEKWGWKINENKWIQFPDYQGRIYKKGMNWFGKVHEIIVGYKNFAKLPIDIEYCIQHHKTIERQKKQNDKYLLM
jgi:hypothetical protein